MKKELLLLAPVLMMLLTGCMTVTGGNVSIKNGEESDATVKKEIKLPGFNEIEASQGIKVIVTQGKYQGKVMVATTPTAEEYLKVIVEKGILKVYYETQSVKVVNIKGPSIINITIPQIKEGRISSGASLTIKDKFVSDNKMEFNLSSGSSLKIDNLSCNELELDTSSGSEATVQNLNGNLDADSSSGSSINVNGIEGGNVEISASSGSGIYLKSIFSASIAAEASSGGSVTLSGKTGNLSKNTSSGGRVNANDLKITK